LWGEIQKIQCCGIGIEINLSRLPGLKFMRTLWVCAISGGPYKFVPTVKGKCLFGLENAHKKFEISPEEFDAVAEELSNSLDHFSVPKKEKNEVLSVFASHKSEVDRGYFKANKIRVADIRCPFSG
jgi:hemoglobin